MKWIVLAIVAAVAFIVVPNFSTTLERSRQNRSMAAMRDTAERIEKGASAGRGSRATSSSSTAPSGRRRSASE
jgi:Tfp pilus assembly protein PilE